MSKLDELKDIIELALDDVDEFSLPNIYAIVQDEQTKNQLIEDIIEVVKRTGDSVYAIINRLERSYNDNMIDD